MRKSWDPDVVIDEDLVRRLLRSQFPDLPLDKIELIGEGRDNAAYLIDGERVFRFPRRQVAAPLILNETRALRLFAGRLPLASPVPMHEGKPEGDYPYPFMGYRLLPGTSACGMEWTEDQRAATAPILGTFLHALHCVDATSEVLEWAPRDSIRRADMSYRLDHTKKLALSLGEALRDFDADSILALMADLAQTEPCKELRWVHGDLYPCHILANEEREITAVIDWGDVHLGDPALDISLAFTFLPRDSWIAFQEAYGGVDESTWNRARFRALHYAFTFIWYGSEEDDGGASGLGRFVLANAAPFE